MPEDQPPRLPTPDAKLTHQGDQLTGFMRIEAAITAAYFKGLCEAGLHRSEALELALVQAHERFYAVYNLKPTKPPE